ncbi:hypothetical protein [Nocardioides sp.]|uniref:hypothetical protein n=1 Tax=Nocardioides sp. TaxID=35761 RepID=UPI00378469D8
MRRRWRSVVAAVVAAVVVVALLVGVALLGWSWRHPTAFDDSGAGFEVGDGGGRVGRTTYIGMTFPGAGEGTVHLDAATPVVVSGGASATTGVLVCTMSGGSAVGLAHGREVEQYCSPLEAAAGADLSLGPEPRQQLMLAVTPTRPGERIKVDGVDVTYTDGWRHGTQRVPGTFTVWVSDHD